MNNKIVNILFSFKGRVSRKIYWLYLIACIVAASIPFILNMSRESADIYINIVIVLFIWPSLAIQIKRWHDINSSGVWLLVNLVPFIGGLWALVANGFMRGTIGENDYGSDPYEHESSK